ncbi:hypothetical protein [Herbiconiux sp. UC225_62]|uniref:hypothetical protein n=1 Tax=Herbiconiux sp. UC225_62 TaxID=3350168 RepID=UPI0036D2DB8E
MTIVGIEFGAPIVALYGGYKVASGAGRFVRGMDQYMQGMAEPIVTKSNLQWDIDVAAGLLPDFTTPLGIVGGFF